MPAPMDLSRVAARSAPQERNVFGKANPGGPRGSGGGRGTGTRADDYARTIAIFSAALALISLAYLLVGLYGGYWGHDHLTTRGMNRALYLRQEQNIEIAFSVLRYSTIAFVISTLIVAARDESVGYFLVIGAAFFYFGLPAISTQVFQTASIKPSSLTSEVVGDLQLLGWIYFIPGVIWVLIDLVRRFRNAADAAAIQRANVTYGANVARQKETQVKQRFLGKCWELPYCKDNIRVRCPIFVKRKGPCWRYRQGCMCEEKIILQAVINKDWKSQTADAEAALSGTAPKASLSPWEKAERCRNCIIYNEHERQKYKLLVTIAMVGIPTLVALNFGMMQVAIMNLLQGAQAFVNRFAYSDSQHLSLAQDGILVWTTVGTLSLVVLTQVLRFIEYLCFKLKI